MILKKFLPDNRQISLLTAFFGCFAVQETIGITVRNPLTVVLFACLFLISKRIYGFKLTGEKANHFLVLSGLVSGIGAGLLAVFINQKASEQFTSAVFRLLSLIILFIGYIFLIELIFFALLLLFKRDAFVVRQLSERGRWIIPLTGALERRIFWLTFLVCFVCYLPYYLYEYPGIMTADSLVQYEQIIGRIPLSNHHPVIHTMTIKLFYELGMAVTGDPIKALSFYTFAQMLFVAICSGVAVREILRIEGIINVKHIVPAMAFFALMPFNAVFAVTMWKDVPFAGIGVLLCCRILEMNRRKNELKPGDYLIYSALGVLFSLFRSNGWIAFIVFTPFFIFAFRKDMIKAVASSLICIVVVLTVKGPVFDRLSVTGPDFVESLSLPLQQVARVIVDEGNLDENDLNMIDHVIDRTYIKQLYVPGYADNIKELVRAGNPQALEEDKAGYLKLWLRLFFKNPVEYIKAFYDLEGGYFYPDVAYTVADVDGIMGNDMGLYSVPVIGGKFIKIKEILLKLSDFMPVYGWFFSIGMYTAALIIGFFVALRKKRVVSVLF